MDFHNFTSTKQFNMEKINRFAKLDALPGFCLLRSEREYLNLYRKLLSEECAVQETVDEPIVEPQPEVEKDKAEETVSKKKKKKIEE